MRHRTCTPEWLPAAGAFDFYRIVDNYYYQLISAKKVGRLSLRAWLPRENPAFDQLNGCQHTPYSVRICIR
jgi:hypothetical protein